VLVAVPDVDAIRWPRSGVPPEVCNADALPQLVTARIAQYCSLGVGPGLLVPDQRRRVAEFLVLKHRPHLVRGAQTALQEGSHGG
jgi:hypothetical protein